MASRGCWRHRASSQSTFSKPQLPVISNKRPWSRWLLDIGSSSGKQYGWVTHTWMCHQSSVCQANYINGVLKSICAQHTSYNSVQNLCSIFDDRRQTNCQTTDIRNDKMPLVLTIPTYSLYSKANKEKKPWTIFHRVRKTPGDSQGERVKPATLVRDTEVQCWRASDKKQHTCQPHEQEARFDASGATHKRATTLKKLTELKLTENSWEKNPKQNMASAFVFPQLLIQWMN